MQYILEQEVCHGSALISCHTSSIIEKNPLTEIQEGELYLCLEHRTVRVRERIINLTSKEFDILALLIANPKRVFTYELITDLVWKEDCDFYSRKAIHNHISKLRKKLRFEPDLPNYRFGQTEKEVAIFTLFDEDTNPVDKIIMNSIE